MGNAHIPKNGNSGAEAAVYHGYTGQGPVGHTGIMPFPTHNAHGTEPAIHHNYTGQAHVGQMSNLHHPTQNAFDRQPPMHHGHTAQVPSGNMGNIEAPANHASGTEVHQQPNQSEQTSASETENSAIPTNASGGESPSDDAYANNTIAPPVRPTTPPFQKLPPEVVGKIFDYVEPGKFVVRQPESSTGIYAVALASKHFEHAVWAHYVDKCRIEFGAHNLRYWAFYHFMKWASDNGWIEKRFQFTFENGVRKDPKIPIVIQNSGLSFFRFRRDMLNISRGAETYERPNRRRWRYRRAAMRKSRELIRALDLTSFNCQLIMRYTAIAESPLHANVKEGDIFHVQDVIRYYVDPNFLLPSDNLVASTITETNGWPQLVHREVEGHWKIKHRTIYNRETMNIKMFPPQDCSSDTSETESC